MKRLIAIAPAIFVAPQMAAQIPDHSGRQQHAQPAQQQRLQDHSQHLPPQSADRHAGHDMGRHDEDVRLIANMAGAFGDYPLSRDGSGTSWVPDASRHSMAHSSPGNWTVMSHAIIDGVYSWQDGPRGDEKAFMGGMLMASARRSLGQDGAILLRGMLSPDPFMGKAGYPLLLAAGETADGVHPLVDRQHPHDLFMELSASYTHRLSDEDSVFFYAGLPGEPAFGPPAFMHRPAASASPEAPITHHWIDSTHITFGVLTAGWVHDRFKAEMSRFRGREPDESRYDIETGELDSTSVRLSWNFADNWALQASWADVASPEQLHPHTDVTKWSASALYTRPLPNGGEIAFTGAFARRDDSDGVELDAWLGEASWTPYPNWTLFSRAEAIEANELGGRHGPIEDVAKLSLGLSRDLRLTDNVTLALGGLVSQNWVSDALAPLYDGDPIGAMAFVRLKIG